MGGGGADAGADHGQVQRDWALKRQQDGDKIQLLDEQDHTTGNKGWQRATDSRQEQCTDWTVVPRCFPEKKTIGDSS